MASGGSVALPAVAAVLLARKCFRAGRRAAPGRVEVPPALEVPEELLFNVSVGFRMGSGDISRPFLACGALAAGG